MNLFAFKQCVTILKSTGQKAAKLRELSAAISKVSDESIFHHTCQYFLREGVLEYTNDFARWAGENLRDVILAEQLSNIDPFIHKSIADLKHEILRTVDEHIIQFSDTLQVLKGDEFYFDETVMLVTNSGLEARNLAEFLIALQHIDVGSLYYHFYDARLRTGGDDDFSRWLETELNEPEPAENIRAIDPFMHTIEGTRKQLIDIVETGLQKEMEKLGVSS